MGEKRGFEVFVVISGGGKVGSFLAMQLLRKGHDVVVIEKDPEVCQRISSKTRALVIKGDTCDYRCREEANVGRADVFAAVTGDDDDNLWPASWPRFISTCSVRWRG